MSDTKKSGKSNGIRKPSDERVVVTRDPLWQTHDVCPICGEILFEEAAVGAHPTPPLEVDGDEIAGVEGSESVVARHFAEAHPGTSWRWEHEMERDTAGGTDQVSR